MEQASIQSQIQLHPSIWEYLLYLTPGNDLLLIEMPQILQNTLPKNDADTWWLIESEKKPNDTSTDTHFPESSKKITTKQTTQ